MKRDYNIYAGMSGGFGGASYVRTLKDVTENEANEWAYQTAIEIFEGYIGLHGIMSYEEAFEEADGDDNVAYELIQEEAERWIECWVVPIEEDDDYDEDDSSYNILN